VNRDFALGCLVLAVAVGYYAASTFIPESQLADAIGPQGLPKTYAVVLALLSFVLIGQSLPRRVRKDPAYVLQSLPRRVPKDPAYGAAQESAHSPRALWRVGGMLLIGVIYIIAAPWIGYIPSLAALILATTYYQGGAINRHVALVSVSGAVFFWLLFVLLLGIPQPAGFWPSPF
jgi:putative tricarboxylic transport membrane protein